MGTKGFIKAERQAMKARIVLTGPAGSGKTKSALLLAFGLTGRTGKIGLLDTNNGMAKIHSDLGDFSVLDMEGPFRTGKYISVVEQAEEEGFDVLIIDSLSPAWAGEGGILEWVDKLSSKGNKSEAWARAQPMHNEMMKRLLKSSIHIIVTLKTKTDYLVIEQNGRLSPKKIGLAPIQAAGIDNDFLVTFDVDQPSHVATASTDHTGLFEGFADVLTEAHGEYLRTWLSVGVNTPAIANKAEAGTENETKSAKTEAGAASDESGTSSASADVVDLFINKVQYKVLSELILATKTDKKIFFEYFKADKLEVFPANRFTQAVEMLEKKGKGKTTGTPPAENGKKAATLADMLTAMNIEFTVGPDGIEAKTDFTAKSAQAFLREKGFAYNSKKKVWAEKKAA